jgi:hypothetical protein
MRRYGERLRLISFKLKGSGVPKGKLINRAKFLLITLLCSGLAAAAEPAIKLTSDKESLSLQLTGLSSAMRRCVSAGLEIKIAFNAQLCRRQSYWFDECGTERKAKAELRFDPISLTYTVEQDLLDDSVKPIRARLNRSQEAFDLANRSLPFSLAFLGGGRERFGVYPLYIRYKAKTFCNENYIRTLDRVARIISFGFVNLAGFESDWQEADVEPVLP